MNECVLIVDDDKAIVNAIAILLEKEGYRTLKAYNGLEALALAAERSVQLIILDVMMPQLDGLSALMRIREKRNLPIIVLSAKSEESDKILGLSMGADDYVTKPSTRRNWRRGCGVSCGGILRWATHRRRPEAARSSTGV